MQKPNYNLAWAVDPGALKSEVTQVHKQFGWQIVNGLGEKPNLNEVNQWRYSAYLWVDYIESEAAERDNELSLLENAVNNVKSGPTEIDGQNVGGVSYEFQVDSAENVETFEFDTFFTKGESPNSTSVETINSGETTQLNINTDSENQSNEQMYTGPASEILQGSAAFATTRALDVKTAQIGGILKRSSGAQYTDSRPTALPQIFNDTYLNREYSERWSWKLDSNPASGDFGFSVSIKYFDKLENTYTNELQVYSTGKSTSDRYDLMSSAVSENYLALSFLKYTERDFRRTNRSYFTLLIEVNTGIVKTLEKDTTAKFSNPNTSPALTDGTYIDHGKPLLNEYVSTGAVFVGSSVDLCETENMVYLARNVLYRKNSKNFSDNQVFELDKTGQFTDLIASPRRYSNNKFEFSEGLSPVDRVNRLNGFLVEPGIEVQKHANSIVKLIEDKFGKLHLLNIRHYSQRTNSTGAFSADIVITSRTMTTNGGFSNVEEHYLDLRPELYATFNNTTLEPCDTFLGAADVYIDEDGKYQVMLGFTHAIGFTPGAQNSISSFAIWADNYNMIKVQATPGTRDLVVKAKGWLDTDVSAYEADFNFTKVNSGTNTVKHGPSSIVRNPLDGSYFVGWRSDHLASFIEESYIGETDRTGVMLSTTATVSGTEVIQNDGNNAYLKDYTGGSDRIVNPYFRGMASSQLIFNGIRGHVSTQYEGIPGSSISSKRVYQSQTWGETSVQTEFFREGKLVSFYTSTDENLSTTVRTKFDCISPLDESALYNGPYAANFYTITGGQATNSIVDSNSATDEYLVTGTPNTTPNDNPLEGTKHGYGFCKFFEKEIFNSDTSYQYQTLKFKQYDAIVSGIDYVQDALDDLYRKLTDQAPSVRLQVSATANTPVTINHGLGQYLVIVQCFLGSGLRADAEVRLVDLNTCTVEIPVTATLDVVVTR